MRGKKALFLAVILLATVLQPVLAINDYGEDEDYLGQVVDDYLTDDNVSMAVGVVHNGTLDCMELNLTVLDEPVYEDLSSYAEVNDGTNDFSQTVTRNSWTTLRRDADGYVYKDFGADYFGDFLANFTLYFSDLEAGDSSSQNSMTAFSIGGVKGDTQTLMGGSYIGVVPIQRGATDDSFNFRWYQWTAGSPEFVVTEAAVCSMGVPYYMTVSRTGTTIGFYVFSDEARTTLIDSYWASGDNTPYRYIQPGTAWSSATDPADHITGYLEYLWIGEVGGTGYGDGYYITEEFLDGDRGLVLLYNATLPANTGIEIEFSDDNATWVDHNGVGASDTLVAGYESLGLRDLNTTSLYVRLNMTTTDPGATPRVYQLRIVTTTDIIPCEECEESAPVAMGKYYAMAIILLILGVLIGIGMRRKR